MHTSYPHGLTFYRRALRAVNPFRAVGAAWRTLSNLLRRRHRDLEYILITLPENLPPLPEPRGFIERRLFGTAPLSLWELDDIFDRIARDPRTRGVVLQFGNLQMPLADLQTLRGQIQRMRARGRRVVIHEQTMDTSLYYVAAAADEILLQPNGDLDLTGLTSEAFFLKDTLAAVGVQLDVVAISPFKSAFDQLSQSEITPESRAQIDWLLDSRYEQIVRGIAEGRGLSTEAVRALIDAGPYTDHAALDAGCVDALAYLDDVPDRLGVEALVPWDEARRKLFKPPPRPFSPKAVAVVTVTGMMVPGESGGVPGDLPLPVPVPIVGEDRTGDVTFVDQIRALQDNPAVGAVVLFIDSGGGAVSAAANMGQALDALARTRPLVAYMNGVAASGGYWVATAARQIFAQPGTITGSIGVITAKPVAGGLLDKLFVHSTLFKRGANADLFDLTLPFTDRQRQQVRASVEAAYQRFLERTARQRGMTIEQVDTVAGGRVWTGEQALEHGLVDALGSLHDAIDRARTLADLPPWAPVVFQEAAGPQPPRARASPTDKAARALNPAAALPYLWENARHIASGRAQAILPVWFRPF